MPETKIEWIVLAGGLCAVAVLVVLVISERTKVPAATARQTLRLRATPRAAPSPRPSDESTAAAHSPPGARSLRLFVAATRGDSWLVIRSGSGAGRVLFQGTLIQGKTLRLSSSRLWMRVGAGANLDVSINGRTATLGAGTFDAVLTPRGIRSP